MVSFFLKISKTKMSDSNNLESNIDFNFIILFNLFD